VQGLNDKGTRDSRVDQSRRSTEGHVASDPAYRRSEFRGFVWHETLGTTSSDFPIGKSPMQEKVDPLTIGVRDSKGPAYGDRIRDSPTDDIPKAETPIPDVS
jgi:hypothetical protein